MMNEFIVWDEKYKIFITEENVSELNDKYGNNDSFYYGNELYPITDADLLFPLDISENERFTKCFHIGIKDINDKPIYADCSIVEFEHEMHGKCVGVFSYSTTELAYLIKLISTEGFVFEYETRINYDVVYASQLTIIDTIQENKLGLIK